MILSFCFLEKPPPRKPRRLGIRNRPWNAQVDLGAGSGAAPDIQFAACLAGSLAHAAQPVVAGTSGLQDLLRNAVPFIPNSQTEEAIAIRNFRFYFVWARAWRKAFRSASRAILYTSSRRIGWRSRTAPSTTRRNWVSLHQPVRRPRMSGREPDRWWLLWKTANRTQHSGPQQSPDPHVRAPAPLRLLLFRRKQLFYCLKAKNQP